MAGRRTDTSRLLTLLSLALVVLVLYAARALLIPLALAILLSFVLGPVVARLEKTGLARIPAVIVTGIMAFSLIALVSAVVVMQVMALANQLPEYRHNIRAKVQTLAGQADSALGRARAGLDQIGKEMMDAAEASPPVTPGARSPGGSEPVDVIVAGEKTSAWDYVRAMLAPVLAPLTGALLVVVFVFFILTKREDLRDRVIRIMGEGRLTRSTQMIDEAALRISRYLQMYLLVNMGFGMCVAIGLLLIGVPNALLWGALAAALRFVPFLGPLVAAALPLTVSLAVFDGWMQPVLTVALFAVLETVIAYFIEPWLFGRRVGVSTLAVLLSLVVWGWLWGPVGLLLATPLTVTLVVMGRHATHLQFFTVLLSDEPALEPDVRLYHRLLSSDHDAATEVAREYARDHSLAELYDNVLIPALALAKRDVHRGALDNGRDQFIYDSMRDIIEEFDAQPAADPGEKDATAEGAGGEAASVSDAAEKATIVPILCLPAHDEADELAALMLARLLIRNGVAAEAVSVHALVGEKLDLVAQQKAGIVFISALPPMAVLHSRYLCKRLTARLPDLRILVGLWNASDSAEARQRLAACGVQAVSTTLSDAAAQLVPQSAAG